MNSVERQTLIFRARSLVDYRPTTEEINRYLARYVSTYEEQLNAALLHMLPETVRQLQQTKNLVVASIGREPSPLSVCVTALQTSLQVPLENRSLQYYESGDHPNFVFWSDIAHGINMVRASMYLAEESIVDDADEAITRGSKEWADFRVESLGVSKEAEYYIVIQKRSRELASLLKSDPTGFTLIRIVSEMITHPKTPNDTLAIFPQNRIVEYVAGGTAMVQAAYKTFYPLAKNNLI